MKTKELILECMLKEKAPTMYKLAQIWNIHSGLLSDYMNGKRVPDEYVAFRIAETLQRDPAEIIAAIRAEITGKHKAYFQNFMLRRGLLGVAAASLLTCNAFYAPESNAANNLANAHNVRLRQTRRRKYQGINKPAAMRVFFRPVKAVYQKEGGRGTA